MKRIVLAGGSGFLGNALARHFRALGWEAVVLTRFPGAVEEGIREIAWDAATVEKWARELEAAEAVINLTGKSVNCRYTPENRRLIMDSRVNSTRVIGQAINQCAKPPSVWLNSSTATVYQHTYGPPWDEFAAWEAAAHAKDKFSLEVAKAWEAALNEATIPATRKVALRTAMVLGLDKNSVFPVLRRLARVGLGGRMGDGKQFVSWIHEQDFCRAVEWIVSHSGLAGPVNVCAPAPLTNAEMMKDFRDICGIPLGLPATEWMLEVGAFFLRTETELILKSRCVIPGKLLKSGFQFNFTHFRDALIELQKRSSEIREK